MHLFFWLNSYFLALIGLLGAAPDWRKFSYVHFYQDILFTVFDMHYTLTKASLVAEIVVHVNADLNMDVHVISKNVKCWIRSRYSLPNKRIGVIKIFCFSSRFTDLFDSKLNFISIIVI